MSYNVYWVGADGNVWARSGDKVSNYGKLIKDFDGKGFDAQYQSAGSDGDLVWDRIADPNKPQEESAPVVASGGGGDSGPNRVLNEAAVNNTKKALGSLDTELDTQYKNIDDSYDSLIGGYDKERTRTKGEYDDGVVSNTQDLQRNKQNALVSGAQGLRGLRGVLASIGALSGDGSNLANRAVTTETNQDIGGAAESYSGNAVKLDKAWDRFDEEDEDRRADAETAKKNQRIAAQGEILSKRQNFYQKLAELYGEVDNIGEATSWLDRAGDLNTSIAEKSRVKATPFQKRGAAFTPGELESYLAGAGDMTVEVAPNASNGTGGPNSVLARQGKRRKEEELALA